MKVAFGKAFDVLRDGVVKSVKTDSDVLELVRSCPNALEHVAGDEDGCGNLDPAPRRASVGIDECPFKLRKEVLVFGYDGDEDRREDRVVADEPPVEPSC